MTKRTILTASLASLAAALAPQVLAPQACHARPTRIPARQAKAVPKAAPRAAANTARGAVLDTRGRPVAGVTVDIAGTATASGGIVGFDPQTNAQGRYLQASLTPGNYTVVAWKQVRYNGATYRVPMSPKIGKAEDQFLSRNGIARDFTWRISGPIASRFFDPDEPGSYLGGSLKVFGRDENGLNEIALPANTLVRGRLVPDGPLMDGSAGREIAFEFRFKPGELYQSIQKDIPVGRYTLSLSAVMEDGSEKAIRIWDGDGHEDADFRATRTIDFAPTGASVRPFQARFVNDVGISVKL